MDQFKFKPLPNSEIPDYQRDAIAYAQNFRRTQRIVQLLRSRKFTPAEIEQIKKAVRHSCALKARACEE